MKILITGASGFVGRHLVSRLSRDHELFAVVRNPDASLPETVSKVVVDLAQSINTDLMPAQMDIIIHLAQANTSFPEAANELFTINTRATQKLLDYGRGAGARQFILASSGDVYGNPLGPFKETDTVAPASFYARTKYAAELVTQSYSEYLRPCILRLFHAYGPGQSNRLIPRLADRIRRRETVQLHKHDRPRLTPVYIDDVTCAIERTISYAHDGILNVAGDRVVSMRELGEEIGRLLGQRPIFEETGVESGDAIGNNALMKRILGEWPMVNLAAGLSLALKSKEETECLTRA